MEALQSHLIDLGFSPYEAEIYCALVQAGPANGSQLARRSGVPRSMAYQALDRLVDKGAVLVAPGSPATYAPVSPAEFFGRLQKEHAARCEALIQGLPAVSADQGPRLVWNLSGAEAIRERARDLYFRAGGRLQTAGVPALVAALSPGGRGAVPSGWCVLLIPHQEALMVEVPPVGEPVAALGRQAAFLAAAASAAREYEARRRRSQPAIPIRQFW